MNYEKVSFQVCDESQAEKVEDFLKKHYGINVFDRIKAKICLTHDCPIEKGYWLESKTIAAFFESLTLLGVMDGTCLSLKRNAVARMAEKLLLSEGMSLAKITLKTPDQYLSLQR